MKRNRRGWLYLLFAVLIMCITLGYAYLNTELNINGTTNVSSANWNIYWDNIVFGTNNVTDVTTPATIQTGDTEVLFNVNFSEPGDTYEFTVDAVNDGTIDGMISVVSNGVYALNGTTPKNLPDYLEYTVTYSDGVTISQNHLLEAGETETYKVRVHYKEDISSSQLPSTADNFVFKFSVTYVQADSNAINKPYYVYTNSNTTCTIDSAIPSGVNSYNNYEDAVANWDLNYNSPFGNFIRHLVSDGKIIASYNSLLESETVYYFQGGVDESSQASKPIYETNKAIANNYGYCSEIDVAHDSYLETRCVVGMFQLDIRSNGYIETESATGPGETIDCIIDNNGTSRCKINFY